LRYPAGVGVLIGVRSRRCFGREAMHRTFTHEYEKATLAWLDGALEHAYSHGQSKALAYLEAVMEDVVFEQEMAVREAPVLG
jgi:ribosomal protein L18